MQNVSSLIKSISTESNDKAMASTLYNLLVIQTGIVFSLRFLPMDIDARTAAFLGTFATQMFSNYLIT